VLAEDEEGGGAAGKLVAPPDSPQSSNPFNSETILSYFLPVAEPVRVEVFALTGQQIH
jgi:hypothetical protein